jgi:hypothetical protein
VPTFGVNLPVQQPRAHGLARRLDKFPGVGYPDLDEFATHELTVMEVIEAASDRTEVIRAQGLTLTIRPW